MVSPRGGVSSCETCLVTELQNPPHPHTHAPCPSEECETHAESFSALSISVYKPRRPARALSALMDECWLCNSLISHAQEKHNSTALKMMPVLLHGRGAHKSPATLGFTKKLNPNFSSKNTQLCKLGQFLGHFE